MKVRNGFVSNSSSSSFTCLIPNSWEPTDEAILQAASDSFCDDHLDDDEKTADLKVIEKVKNEIDKFKSTEYTIHEYDEHAMFSTLGMLIPYEYMIGGADTGPDMGTISSVNKDKIRGLLNED